MKTIGSIHSLIGVFCCLFANISLAGTPKVEAPSDEIVLCASRLDPVLKKIVIASVSNEDVLALPRLIGERRVLGKTIDAGGLIASARKWIEGRRGLEVKKEGVYVHLVDPVEGSGDSVLVESCEWVFESIQLKEIDIGRRRGSPATWEPVKSGRLFATVRFRCLPKLGRKMGGVYEVFLLQGGVVVPLSPRDALPEELAFDEFVRMEQSMNRLDEPDDRFSKDDPFE